MLCIWMKTGVHRWLGSDEESVCSCVCVLRVCRRGAVGSLARVRLDVVSAQLVWDQMKLHVHTSAEGHPHDNTPSLYLCRLISILDCNGIFDLGYFLKIIGWKLLVVFIVFDHKWYIIIFSSNCKSRIYKKCWSAVRFMEWSCVNLSVSIREYSQRIKLLSELILFIL